MNLDAARKRHGKPARRRVLALPGVSLPAEINVTPLVDVVLVLLIIFMVMTPLVEQQLHVLLPTERRSESASEVSQQLIVSLSATGAITINEQAVTAPLYIERLRELLAMRADRTVFVAAADGASYSALVEVLSGARRAGAVSVAVVP